MAVEAIKPYGQKGSKHEQVEAMFNHIAPTYDTLNHTLSLGVDRLWRRSAIKKIKTLSPHRGESQESRAKGQESRVESQGVKDDFKSSPSGELERGSGVFLDVATGTGDLAIEAYKTLRPDEIIGCDISDEMMRIGRQKAAEAGLAEHIKFVHEDCEHLSFADGTFDMVMSAFALRNFEHVGACLREMRRVMKPDGCAVIIDLCAPRRFPMRQVFWLYQHTIMPLLGRILSNDQQAYSYLPRTMAAVAQGEEMVAKFHEAGFLHVEYKYLAFDMCCMYCASKV